jgi:uncharacterized protein
VIAEGKPVVFYQDDGYRLDGDLYLPPEGEAEAALVFCHGWGGVRNQMAPNLCSELAARVPAAVLGFDYSGWGTSEGPRERLDPEREIADVRCAVSYLLATRRRSQGRIGLFGLSFGGAIATSAAGRDERVTALVAVPTSANGERLVREQRQHYLYVDFEETVERDRLERTVAGHSRKVDPDWISIRDATALAFARKQAETDSSRNFALDLVSAERIFEMAPDRDAPKLRGRPSLFVSMGRDLRTPTGQCRDVAAFAGGRYVEVPGLGHYDIYKPDRIEWLLELVSGFYKEALQT